MGKVKYGNYILHYDYVYYAWVVSTLNGDLIANFTTLDRAKKFIDDALDG